MSAKEKRSPAEEQEPRKRTDAPEELQFHPAAELFPLSTDGKDFKDFKEDIRINGQGEPIRMFEGKILDGRRRYLACMELGIEPLVEEWKFDGSPFAFAASLNFHRRHLKSSQRALVAAKLKKMYEEAAQRRMHNEKRKDDPPMTSLEGAKVEAAEQAAKQLNVGKDSLYKAQKVLNKGTPELQQAVESGELSVNAAAKLAELTPGAQVAAVLEMKHQKANGNRKGKKGKEERAPGGSEPTTPAQALVQAWPRDEEKLAAAIKAKLKEIFGE